MVFFSQLFTKFHNRVDGRIYLPPQDILSFLDPADDLRKRNLSDHEKIDVTIAIFPSVSD